MNIETLQNIYINNIDKIFTPDNFRIISDHRNNIACDSFTNRALVFIQNRYATDVREIEAWEILGRQVNDNAVPLGTIRSLINNNYFDKDGKQVDTKELTPEEFRNAIRLGLITKSPIVNDVKCRVCYDIRDTHETFTVDKGSKAKLKLSSLYNLLVDLGISVEKEYDTDTTFDKINMTVIIGDDDIGSKLETCIDALVIKVMIICGIDIENNNIIKEVCRVYTIYSLYTFFDMSTDDIQFDCINDLDKDDTDTVTELLDAIESLIQSNIINDGCNTLYGIRPDKMARAAMLLSILESNYQASQMRGNK